MMPAVGVVPGVAVAVIPVGGSSVVAKAIGTRVQVVAPRRRSSAGG
jgi:hypothetical protein